VLKKPREATLPLPLLYHPRISNRSYSGRQVPLASTTRGSPLAAKRGTMDGNGGQMMPEICTQGFLTCRKSATWDRKFYFPSEGRRAEGFLSPFKNSTTSTGFEPANLGIRGQHATSAPPKPLRCILVQQCTRKKTLQ
jgi:hypothetical protein